jgi:hypothetical protein
MIENETPRTRSLLRQAARNVDGGKLAAAEKLYRQIVAETPESVTAWLGLAKTTQDTTEKQVAYERVLALDGDNAEAQAGLAIMRGEPLAAEAPTTGENVAVEQESLDPAAGEFSAETTNPGGDGTPTIPAAMTAAMIKDAASDVKAVENRADQVDDHVAVYDPDVDLFCYRHPNRSTSLRCYKCNKPICSECAVKTPVGYLCPDCHREAEDAFFNAKPTDYLLALLVALPLSLLAGWVAVRFSGGIFMILLFIFAGGAVGGFIARMSKRIMGNRRGRYIPYLVAACIVIGALVWAWPWLLFFLTGGTEVIWKLAGIGVYLFTAASAAYYWAR